MLQNTIRGRIKNMSASLPFPQSLIPRSLAERSVISFAVSFSDSLCIFKYLCIYCFLTDNWQHLLPVASCFALFT